MKFCWLYLICYIGNYLIFLLAISLSIISFFRATEELKKLLVKRKNSDNEADDDISSVKKLKSDLQAAAAAAQSEIRYANIKFYFQS